MPLGKAQTHAPSNTLAYPLSQKRKKGGKCFDFEKKMELQHSNESEEDKKVSASGSPSTCSPVSRPTTSARTHVFVIKLRRLLRALYAFVVLLLPCIAFVLIAFTGGSSQWGAQRVAGGGAGIGQLSSRKLDTYVYVSFVGQNCTCADLTTDSCVEAADYWKGTTYLSWANCGIEQLMLMIAAWELAKYGVFGGSTTFTRLLLITSLGAVATQALSLMIFMWGFHARQCGADSHYNSGSQLHWGFYGRSAELAGTLLLVFSILRRSGATRRGPPCSLLLQLLFLFSLGTLTSACVGWFRTGNRWSGTQYSCQCSSVVSATPVLFYCSMALFAIEWLVCCVEVVFVLMRAVDNLGVTIKFSSALSFIALSLHIAVAIVTMRCLKGVESRSQSGGAANFALGFSLAWYATVACAAGQALFFVLNSVYLLPSCCCGGSGRSPSASAPGSPSAATASCEEAPHIKKKLFRALWWDELRDDRTLAEEYRRFREREAQVGEEEEAASRGLAASPELQRSTSPTNNSSRQSPLLVVEGNKQPPSSGEGESANKLATLSPATHALPTQDKPYSVDEIEG